MNNDTATLKSELFEFAGDAVVDLAAALPTVITLADGDAVEMLVQLVAHLPLNLRFRWLAQHRDYVSRYVTRKA